MSNRTFRGLFAVAALAVAPTAFADPAFVLNWGRDDVTCGAICGIDEAGEPIECVVDGKATQVITADGYLTLSCNDADWLFDAPETPDRGEIDCGLESPGKYVITPSGKVNFWCKGHLW